ncbi:MAG: YbaN family protein [Candidatus Bathyarchaeota archaeon]|nr:YbaN family protein [Candidatus Bathyarchaeota archaeon]
MSNHPPISQSKIKKQKALRVLLMIVGTISLALGTIGLFLPILPTTPFLLLAAACYLRSSERMHKWLLGNRWFGEYIKNYQAGRGIPMKTKLVALAVLWGTILYSTFFVVDEVLVLQVVLVAIAVGVSAHLIRLPTFKGTCRNQPQKSL